MGQVYQGVLVLLVLGVPAGGLVEAESTSEQTQMCYETKCSLHFNYSCTRLEHLSAGLEVGL